MSGSSAGDSVICPACEAENPVGSRFCERCGTRLPPRQREAESGATLTFQRLPADYAAPPAAEPTAAAESEPFERTLIGTPPLGDAAFPGGFPGTSAPDPAPFVDERPAPAPVPPAAEPPPSSVPPAAPPESPRDRPTMTFQLPDLSPPSSESRSAPTVSFQLPDLSNAGSAGSSPSSGTPPVMPPAAAESPAAAGGQPGDNWSYQTWRPDPDAPSAPAVGEVGPGGTRRSIDLGGVAPRPPAPTPAEALPPPAPPVRREGAAPPVSPVSYPQAPAPQYPASPASPGWTPPATPPVVSYPGQGMAQAPAAPNYGPQPGQMAYPTPSERGNNRALWIILGVIGALLVLCVLGCVVLFLIGAFTGGTSSSSFATAVPTITR